MEELFSKDEYKLSEKERAFKNELVKKHGRNSPESKSVLDFKTAKKNLI